MKIQTLFRSHRPVVGLLVGSAVLLILAGCSSTTTTPTGPTTGTQRDLVLRVNSLPTTTPRIPLQVRVIDANNRLVTAGTIAPGTDSTFTITLPKAIMSNGTYHVDFFTDIVGSGVFDSTGDRGWRVAVPANDTVNFTFDTTTALAGFNENNLNLGGGQNFTMNFTGFTPVLGQNLQVRVVDTATGQTVGFLSAGGVGSDAFTMSLPGVIQNNRIYRTNFFVNNTGTFTPGVDNGWSVTGTGTATGLSQNFTYNTTNYANNFAW